MTGKFGGCMKFIRPPVVCSVEGCKSVAHWDVLIEIGNARLKAINVPMCKKHGEYTAPSTGNYEDMQITKAGMR